MYKNDAKLFGDAVLNGIINRFEKEMSQNDENDLCSEAHIEAMLGIIDKTNSREKKRSRAGLIAALIAAALLLVGCTTCVYRNQIGSFIETFFEDSVNISFTKDDKDYITEIEDVYEMLYVPEGYTLTDTFISDTYVMYTYHDEHGNIIAFDQWPLGVSYSIGIDNDADEGSVFEHNGVEIYMRVNKKTRHYVWKNDKYVLNLVCSSVISEEEVVKIIDGVK